MNQFLFRFRELWFFWLVFLFSSNGLWAAEPRVQILSPKDGSRITQEQNSVLISGKVATDLGRSPNVGYRLCHRHLREHVAIRRGGFRRYGSRSLIIPVPLVWEDRRFLSAASELASRHSGICVTLFWLPRSRPPAGCCSSSIQRPHGLAWSRSEKELKCSNP